MIDAAIRWTVVASRDTDTAVRTHALPAVDRSADPADPFLRALAEAGQAGYPVSGDGRRVLLLGSSRRTRIGRAACSCRTHRTTSVQCARASRFAT
jgi:predicted nucleic acid-binding protein